MSSFALALAVAGWLNFTGGDAAASTPAFALPDWAAFVDALDTTRPELARVREKMEQGDVDGAVLAYVAYFRSKPLDGSLFSDYDPRNREHDTAAADAHLEGHLWDGYNTCHVTADGPDWHYCPIICVTRFPFFSRVLQAYFHTRDSRYARFMIDYCLSYIEDWPIHEFQGNEFLEGFWGDDYKTFLAKAERDRRVFEPWHWCMIDQRIFAWCDALRIMRNCPDIKDEELALVLRRLHEETDFMLHRSEERRKLQRYHNGRLSLIKTLAIATRVLADFRIAKQWRAAAVDEFYDYLNGAFYPDGFCKELAVAYSIACSAGVQQLALEFRDDPGVERAKPILEASVIAIPALAKPRGGLPAFGDCVPNDWRTYGVGSAARWLGLDWVHALERGHSEPAPPFVSYPPPGMNFYNGYYVMRSGWDADARYLAIDGGPWGASHQHGDRLSFVLAAYGADFVTDPGWGKYHTNAPDAFLTRLQASFLHNTVTVNGDDEFFTGPKVTESPLADNTWESNESLDLFEGQFDFRPKQEVTWRRRVLFVRPDYWVLQDVLTGEPKSVEVEQNFQFPSQARVELTDGGAVAKAPNGARLLLRPLESSLEAAITIGDDAPHHTNWPIDFGEPHFKHGRGWVSYHGSDRLTPAPALTFHGRVELPCLLTIALIPAPPGSPVSGVPNIVSAKSANEIVLRLPHAEGVVVWRTCIESNTVE